MLNPIIFYGERGLVNGMVIELTDNINLTKKFLKSIRFCGTESPSWIDRVQKVTYLVEPSFSDFGNPDLIIVCDCGEEKHVIFLEAKVVKYLDSAIKLDKKGAPTPGINSRINTQLTLKYRLSVALQQNNQVSNAKFIEESLDNWLPYKDYPTETSKKPRRLIKNIELINDYFSGVKDYWFVALTTDNSKSRPYNSADFRPLVLDSSGQIIWDSVKDHFGLITYDRLNNILAQDGVYYLARKYFLEKGLDSIHIKTENWNDFSSFINHTLRIKLQQIIEDAIDSISGAGLTQQILKKYNGSDSYSPNERTLIKLVPKHFNGEEKLFIAVLAGPAKAAGIAELFSDGFYKIGIGNRGRDFLCHAFTTIPSKEDTAAMVWALSEFWKESIIQ